MDLIKGLFNYQDLGKTFQIAPEDLFIVMSHEIAYELFAMLAEQPSPVLIPILRSNNPNLSFRYLVSLKRASK